MPQNPIIILAAGNSSRMGRPKQLLDFRGTPLLRHAAQTALSAQCGPVIVVLGAAEHDMRPVLQHLSVEIVLNPRWIEGMGTSIHAGLSHAGRHDIDGVILTLADQPLVTAEFLKGLVSRHVETGKPIVASRYAGTAGVPAYFTRQYFHLLAALPPDQGCKGVILGNPQDSELIDCPAALSDIDTPEDYAQLNDGRGIP